MSKAENIGGANPPPEGLQERGVFVEAGLLTLTAARRMHIFDLLRSDYCGKQEGLTEEEILDSLKASWLAHTDSTIEMVLHHLIRLREVEVAFYYDDRWYYNDEAERSVGHLGFIVDDFEFDDEDREKLKIPAEEVRRSRSMGKGVVLENDDVPYLRHRPQYRSFNPNAPKISMWGQDGESYWDDDGQLEPG